MAQMRRVERSIYSRAVGYNYEAVKIFMPANREKPVIVISSSGVCLRYGAGLEKAAR